MGPGDELAGRYVLEEVLGQGGMGQVWRAVDRRLERSVAVKVLLEDDPSAERVARFRREARLAARLLHPGITTVFDADQHDGRLFIVMELLDGTDLATVLDGTPTGLPVEEAAMLTLQAAEALAVAHEHGVIHRDLKPANLFRGTDGRLKICDFGIARAPDVTPLTLAGHPIGTPAYMSPEQWRGEQPNDRSDLYSLGCVLYALLTGRPPFPAGQLVELMRQHLFETPASPRLHRTDIPARLESLILELLAKDAADRPASAAAVAVTLHNILTAPPATSAHKAAATIPDSSAPPTDSHHTPGVEQHASPAREGRVIQAAGLGAVHVTGGQPYEIGVGEPGWTGPFHRAWSELMNEGLLIGNPSSDVYRLGPGVVQHFQSHRSLFGWVLCALPHQRPVAVAGEVWHALQAAGAGVPGGDGLSALGFPAPDPHTTRQIDAQAHRVDLTGGQWRDGRLVRDADGQDWQWEPDLRFSMNMSFASGYWTAEQAAARHLRLRALAVLPWADARDLQITGERRLALEQALPVSELGAFITTLSRWRGTGLAAPNWFRGPHRNALDAFSYSTSIAAPGGQTALSAGVMMALPSTMNSSAVTCAELRIEDLAAWAGALSASGGNPPDDLRLSIEEVIEFFIVAGRTANEMLASTVADSLPSVRWADPPTTELQLIAERRHDADPNVQPMLDDYIDMSALGHSDRGRLPQMLVTITAPPQMAPSERRRVTRQAMVYMAQQFGFIDLTEAGL